MNHPAQKRQHITDWQVCKAYADFAAHGNPLPTDRIAHATGAVDKVVIAAINRAARRGLIDCGVSLRTGWLTDAGMRTLKE